MTATYTNTETYPNNVKPVMEIMAMRGQPTMRVCIFTICFINRKVYPSISKRPLVICDNLNNLWVVYHHGICRITVGN